MGRLFRHHYTIKGQEKKNDEMINKNEKPKGDEYIVSPCLRQRVENS